MKQNKMEDSSISRNPPSGVKKHLRSEVNFGCPICGSPYLTYHHYDPPWNKKHHNKPDGMIALCVKHHGLADCGTYTKEQIKKFKKNPILKNPLISQGKFEWLRNELILEAGGFYLDSHVYLRIDGQNIIWFNRDKENNILLNLNIVDMNGDSVVLIENNDWISIGSSEEIDDIEVPPCGRSLTIKAKNLGLQRINITFIEASQLALRKRGQVLNLKLDEHPGPQGPIGPLADVTDDAIHRIIENSISTKEHKTILKMIEAKELYKSIPTRWEMLTNAIKEWPVTICRISLHCKYPFPINLSPSTENYLGWKAGHTISIGSNTVWDLISPSSKSG